MTYIQRSVVDLISEMFGLPRHYSHGQADVAFNCPKCDTRGNKYNLEVNVSKGVYHCWSCGYKGKLLRLFKDFASERQWTILKRLPIYRESTGELSVDSTTGPAPAPVDIKKSLGSYRSLSVDWGNSPHYNAALKYLRGRGITSDIIAKWDICYSETGPNKFRIIIPSRAANGVLEYYIARGFYDYIKPKYKNPTIPKQQIIFGERFIDWHRPVVLTEGVFDSIISLNAIPILGTEIRTHKKLLKKLRANNTPVTICLDSEAWKSAKKAYKVLDDLGIDVKIVRIPDFLEDLSSAFERGGKKAVLHILDSAHKLTFEEALW